MQTRIIGGTLMLAFGSVLGVLAVFAFVRGFRRQMRGCAAMGTVVGHQERQHSEWPTYSPEVEFQTADGERVRFVASCGSSHRPTLGRRVRVLYYANDPADAALVSFADIWVMPLLLLVPAVGLLALSVLFYTGILVD